MNPQFRPCEQTSVEEAPKQPSKLRQAQMLVHLLDNVRSESKRLLNEQRQHLLKRMMQNDTYLTAMGFRSKPKTAQRKKTSKSQNCGRKQQTVTASSARKQQQQQTSHSVPPRNQKVKATPKSKPKRFVRTLVLTSTTHCSQLSLAWNL